MANPKMQINAFSVPMQGFPEHRLILVVENNPEHIDTIRRAFDLGATPYQLEILADGQQALAFLQQQGDYANARRPDLILLALNLPGKDGHQVLAEIKANPDLRRIPIVVLTVSDRDEDILTSYALQGNCYVIKPAAGDRLFQIVKRIEEFWLGIVTLPLE
ncbi:response regulator [Trichothermofontia sp.]